MQFVDWVRGQPRGVLKRIERQQNVGYGTIFRAVRGQAVSFPIAKKLSAATNGAVSIEELCDPKPMAVGE